MDGSVESLVGFTRAGWQVAALGDLVELTTGPGGGQLKKSDQAVTGVPLMNAESVTENGCSVNPVRFITEDTATRLGRYRLTEGDIVMIRVGDPNYVGIAHLEHNGWILGANCIRLRTVVPSVLPGFLVCYLSHPSVREWLRTRTGSTAIPSVKAEDVRQIPVPLPPFEDQIAIASMVEAFSAKIETSREMLRVSEAMRRAALREVFGA